MGDGTTSVVVLAGELLREAELLVNQKIHPMVIIAGEPLPGSARQAVDHIIAGRRLRLGCWGLSCELVLAQPGSGMKSILCLSRAEVSARKVAHCICMACPLGCRVPRGRRGGAGAAAGDCSGQQGRRCKVPGGPAEHCQDHTEQQDPHAGWAGSGMLGVLPCGPALATCLLAK